MKDFKTPEMCLITGAGEKNDCTVGDNGLVADLIGNEF